MNKIDIATFGKKLDTTKRSKYISSAVSFIDKIMNAKRIRNHNDAIGVDNQCLATSFPNIFLDKKTI